MFETRADVMAMFEQFRSVDKADLSGQLSVDKADLVDKANFGENLSGQGGPVWTSEQGGSRWTRRTSARARRLKTMRSSS